MKESCFGSRATNALPREVYQVGFDNGVRGTDDFVIPAGKEWHVGEIKVTGQLFSGEQQSGEVIVIIYGQQNIQCIRTATATPRPSGDGSNVDYVVDLATVDDCVLFGGYLNRTRGVVIEDTTYWLSFTPVLSIRQNKSHFDWAFSTTTNGERFHWRDRDDLFRKGKCNRDFGSSEDCGLETVHDGFDRSDLCFQVKGFETDLDTNDMKVFERGMRAGTTVFVIGPHKSWGAAVTQETMDDIESTSIVVKEIYPEVPGWGIALIVLASLAVVLLLVGAVLIVRRSRNVKERV